MSTFERADSVEHTSPEVAAGSSGGLTNAPAPIGAAGKDSPQHGASSGRENEGLLPPSHWTQLAEVGDYEQSSVMSAAPPKIRTSWLSLLP